MKLNIKKDDLIVVINLISQIYDKEIGISKFFLRLTAEAQRRRVFLKTKG
jgi:hypothetical protein